MSAYSDEAEQRARSSDTQAFSHVQEALVRYFDAGDNDAEQSEMLKRMVTSAVSLGAGYAAVERVLGVELTHTDPRVFEAMAQSAASSGFPPEVSQVLGVCLDIGHFIAKEPGTERFMTNTILRDANTDQSRRVLAELRSLDG